MSKVVKKPNLPYGLYREEPITNWQVELLVWREWEKLSKQPGFKSPHQRWQHLRNAACMLWPEYLRTWNAWTDKMCQAYTDYTYNAALGCTCSTKTHTFHMLAMLDWLSDPKNTQVICTTTSLNGLKTRMWPIISSHARVLGGAVSMRTNPSLLLQLDPKDYKHAIRGVAIEERADEGTLIDNLIGAHSKRVIWIVDEATSAPAALLKVWSNALAGTSYRKMIMLGNPDDQHDTLGQFCRPTSGWDGMDEEVEDWEFSFYGETGLGMHFDGRKSPALASPELNFGIYGLNELKAHTAIKETDPLTYWRMCVGWYAEDGVVPRVISMAEIDRHKCRADVIFKGRYTRFMSLDPAFGGDRCQLMLWKHGISVETGKDVMFKEKSVSIPIRPKEDPIPQIGEFVTRMAQEYGVTDIGIDCSANNSSVATWLKLNSLMKVHEVSFGDGASDMAVSPADSTPCKDKYTNMVTELWFGVKNALPQIRGLSADDCSELVSRFFKREGKPEKMRLESKADMKKRIGRSPDLADCIAIGVHVFRKLGAFSPEGMARSNKSWKQLAQKKNNLYHGQYAAHT